MICQSCSVVSNCLFLNDQWLTIPVDSCDTQNGYYCNLNDRGCSNSTGPCNPVGHETNFVCNTEGIFPDPYDCQVYHICFQTGPNYVAINMNCPGNSAFSPQSNECTSLLTDSVCTEPQFLCTNAGDQAAWPGNNNIFYMCIAANVNGERILYPVLFRCPSRQIFNGVTCVANESITTNPDNPDPPTSENPDNFVCQSRGLFPDPTNCQFFFICDSNLVSTRNECPANSFFDVNSGGCIRGTC